MRDDIYKEFVKKKTDVLARTGMWLNPQSMKPTAWLNNFEQSDRLVASKLLDQFVFCNSRTVDSLLIAAWNSIGDGFPKSSNYDRSDNLIEHLQYAKITAVEGETPNPTDSGHTMCRKARQVLHINEDSILNISEALSEAERGHTIVFIDDFVGSGQQFVKTWERIIDGRSFSDIQKNIKFVAIYVTLACTLKGIDYILSIVPNLHICTASKIGEEQSVYNMIKKNILTKEELNIFLDKYTPRLRPVEEYIAKCPQNLKWGFNELGLMLGFEHSVPDATLPIFWANGTDGWRPLIERR